MNDYDATARDRRRVRRFEPPLTGCARGGAGRACSRARSRLGGRATTRSRIGKPASWSTTASTCCSAATRETFVVPRTTSSAADNVSLQSQLARDDDRSRRAASRDSTVLDAAAAAFSSLPACSTGTRSPGAIGCRCFGWPTPLRLARRQLRRAPVATLPRRRARPSTNWLIRNGQTARLREMLWEPWRWLRSTSRRRASGRPVPSPVCSAEMFGDDAGGGDRLLPDQARFTRCTPSPRARTSKRHGGIGVDAARPRPSASTEVSSLRVSQRRRSLAPRAVIAASALVRDRAISSSGDLSSRRPTASSERERGLVACRDREPVVRSATCSTSRSWVCPGVRCSGSFDKRPVLRKRSRVAPVVGVERGGFPLVQRSNRGAHCPRASRSCSRRFRQPRSSQLLRASVVREPRRDVLARHRGSRSAQARKPRSKASTSPATGLPRVCPPPSRARSEAAIGLPTRIESCAAELSAELRCQRQPPALSHQLVFNS